MDCGCGGSNSGGPLLSGALDGGAYADNTPDTSNTGIVPDVAETNAQAQFRSRGFWFLVVIFVIGAAWYASDKKRGDS
jgi:hypothetical protein